MPDATGKRWYLVQCKPRQTSRALENLERQQYKCLLALHQVERLHNGDLLRLHEPLFPGYLFIYLDKVEDNWLPIRSTRGVSQIVSFGGRPTPVPDSVISQLSHPRLNHTPTLTMGDKVSIKEAGLNQLEAIFLEKDGQGRVLLLLNLLQREVLVKAPIHRLEKL